MNGLAGVVVLYHPKSEVAENVTGYLDCVDFLVIVDNSPVGPRPLKEAWKDRGSILYLDDGINKGVAAALNIGAREAVSRGYRWLLTMDQDSRFEPGALEKLLEFAQAHPQAGIVAPRHMLPGSHRDRIRGECREVETTFTSGNLVNLDAFQAVGPFREGFFIDYIDVEYCLRLRESGYKIWVVHGARLLHELGDASPRSVFGRLIHPTNHSHLRRYYLTRNCLYTIRAHPGFLRAGIRALAREIGLVLFEKKRGRKLLFMARGALDCLRNRQGSRWADSMGGERKGGLTVNFILPFLEKTGGIAVVLEHAYQLSRRGHDVAVYYPMLPYVEYWHTAKFRFRKTLGLTKGFLVNLFLFRRKVSWFHKPHGLRPVPWIGNPTIRNADATVATAFPTAYSVHALNASKGRKYYFMQGHERWMVDPEVVDRTYGLPLELITIAPHLTELLRNRFNRSVRAEIHNGIDLNVFIPPAGGKKWGEPNILMLYHENQVKGTSDGLKALDEVHRRHPSVRMHLFGMFEPPPDLPSHFEYHFDPDLNRLVGLYQGAQIFLSPSRLEGWHLPPMEAMACQCAVVATRVGCIPSLRDGSNMLDVEPFDWQAMADGVNFLVENPEDCKAIALRGYATICEYTWERSSSQLEQVFTADRQHSETLDP